MASNAPTVGRRAELDLLGARLDALADGTPGCLAVEGEAGIGKTRLLGELRGQAQERGHLVLGGSAAEFERDLPFGVWVDALDDHLAARGSELAHEHLPGLAGIAPTLARRHGVADGGGPGDQRHRTHRAVRALLAELASERPLVLVLDDLHWSDEASLGLIAALVRREPAAPVLLALAYRTGQVPARLSTALAGAGPALLTLAPLADADSLVLAGTRRDAAAIVAESGGNPFYILQLTARADRPVARRRDVALGIDVPRTVAAALAEELDGLSPVARALVQGGAIAGDPFEPELAYEIAGLEAEAGRAALDELLAIRMVVPTAIPRRFAFRHPLVRHAVYATTPHGWRHGGHARAAAGLEARGASEAARAHHVEQSAAAGDLDAVAVLLAAGRADAPRAPAGAARWFAAALRLMPDSDVAGRREALVRLAHALRSTGDLDHSAAALEQALELVPPDAVDERVQLTAACAACEHFLGRHERAERRLARLLAGVPAGDSRTVVTLLLAQAVSAFFSLDVAGGREVSRRALAMARRLGEPTLEMATAAALAHAAANAGATEESAPAIDAAARHLDGLADAVAAGQIDAINRIAWSEFLLERDGAAAGHARRGIAVARATGQDQFVPMLCGALAHAQLRLGDLEAAAATQAEATETAELTANGYVTCWVLTTTAAVLVARGDLEGARDAGEQAVALLEGLEGGRIGAMAALRLAMTLRELGAGEPATARLVAPAGGWSMALVPPSWRVPHLEALVRIELRAGDVEAAEARAAAAQRDATRLGLPVAGALAERARAAVALARGAAAGAAEAAERAAAAAHGAPLEAARALALAGAAHAAHDDRPRAVALLRDAERVFDVAGALADRAAARRDLRRLGARTEPRGPSGRGDSGVPALSAREREVAELVVARKTNRQVAAELFLSEKTVETHLRSIFFKLGVSSRVEVARAVEAAPRAPGT